MLYLKNNNLTGNVPSSLGNLTSLRELYISYNDLEGELPETIANLRSLLMIGASENNLSGEFPPALYNLSSLQLIGLSFNKFRGSLRPDIGSAFPNLQRLYLANNYFTGSIPASLSNCSDLLQLDIPMNNFTGNIPMSFGNLKNLFWLNVLSNQLGSGAPDDLNFINSLTNCRKLEFLDIAENKFEGTLPNSITNLSTTLTRLLIGNNRISGTIPKEISNLVNLNVLNIRGTLINGSIPDSIGMLSNLKNLHLESNQLIGNIPSSGNIRRILYIYLQDNRLEGTIPSSLGNCTSLQTLDISHNKLSGRIPKQLVALSSLSILLNMAYNSLSGSLPEEIGNLTNLAALDISNNKLSGEIPHTLESCSSLEILYMQGNYFEGTIPPLNNLKNIQFLDLSRNNLSGNIPKSIAKQFSLQNLNLSFNHLDGEVPVEGVFADASRIQVTGNINLCGGIRQLHLHPCPKQQARKKPKKHTSLIIVLLVGTIAAFLTLFLLIAFCCEKKVKHRPSLASSLGEGYTKVSYGDLLNATGGFSSNSLIGSGGFGSVYRGSLSPEGTIVAVKVLKLDKKGASKSFLAECEALRNVRHRNLVRILTVCSSVDFNGNEFKALVYSFMEKGSLDEWLNPKEGQMLEKRLSILQRLNITIDVASALHYLHSQCHTSIVHCDLKPSNVLLDNDLNALVSDFGLARFLSDSGQDADANLFSSVGIKGTIGYAAPEYGMGGQVSSQGDVYSFGILLLEIITGRRPTSELFEDNENLHSFVKHALPGQVMNIVDQSALYDKEPGDLMEILSSRSDFRSDFVDCLVPILNTGVACSEETPLARMSMGQVILDLISIRDKLSRILAHSKKVNSSRKN